MHRADQAKRPCPMWLLPGMVQAMAVYVWQQELDPGFPLAVLEYAVHGDGDPLHWHDHLEIALVLEGRGGFELGGRRLPAHPGDVFFIDDSQPHVARAEPGADLRLLLVLFRPELIAGPGCREFDLGYLAAFRPDRSDRFTSYRRVQPTLDRDPPGALGTPATLRPRRLS